MLTGLASGSRNIIDRLPHGMSFGCWSPSLTRLSIRARSAWSRAYPSILDAAEREPEIASLQQQLHRSFMAPFEAVLERATAEIIASLVGALFFRRWFSREAIDAQFVAKLIETVLR